MHHANASRLAVLLLWCLVAQAAVDRDSDPTGTPAQPDFQKGSPSSAPQFSPDNIIVKLKGGPGNKASAAPRVVRLSAGADVAAIVKAYKLRQDVEYAEPDYLITPDAIPSDPLWSSQWGVKKISAQLAWDTTPDSSNVTVCVIDSGVDASHPDLAPNMHPAIGYNVLSKNNNVTDVLKHGTHVAGILGAAGNNGVGVAGLNWKVKVLACKFMNDKGVGSTSNAAACIQYCTAQGARIISASWSGTGYSQCLRDAISKAGAAGVLFVTSAGNEKTDLETTKNYPASYKLPNMLTVASTSNTDKLSSFSNFGNATVHLAAPGEWIMSTLPNNKTGYMTGTSMATPMVSGAAALVLAASGGSLNVTGLRQLLLGSVDQVAGLATKVVTKGRLNVNAALLQYAASQNVTVSAKMAVVEGGMGQDQGQEDRAAQQQLLAGQEQAVKQLQRRGEDNIAEQGKEQQEPAWQQWQRKGAGRRLLRGGSRH